uniref:(northern house mosquito) hypothetical protein n=1 Tax=Culex pipiens TaxID=7175 RepID=A0A8D8FJ07_CULPI
MQSVRVPGGGVQRAAAVRGDPEQADHRGDRKRKCHPDTTPPGGLRPQLDGLRLRDVQQRRRSPQEPVHVPVYPAFDSPPELGLLLDRFSVRIVLHAVDPHLPQPIFGLDGIDGRYRHGAVRHGHPGGRRGPAAAKQPELVDLRRHQGHQDHPRKQATSLHPALPQLIGKSRGTTRQEQPDLRVSRCNGHRRKPCPDTGTVPHRARPGEPQPDPVLVPHPRHDPLLQAPRTTRRQPHPEQTPQD